MRAIVPAGRYHKAVSTRRIFYLLITATALLSSISSVRGQTSIKLSGLVLDKSTGAPISSALVEIEPSGQTTLSDGLGKFAFTDIPPGEYKIAAKRLGYLKESPSKILLDEYYSESQTIWLTPVPLEVEGTTVLGEQSDIVIRRGPDGAIIDLSGSQPVSISDIVEKLPELELVESGAGRFLRIRGAGLNGTLIMIDGIAANSTLDSRGDISSIPIASVVRIEINTSGQGKSGLAGSVNFITGIRSSRNKSLESQKGSFGLEDYSASAVFSPIGNLDISVAASREFYRGDFDFTDPRDSVQTRSNNHRLTERIFLTGISDRQMAYVKFNLGYLARTAGVPGPVFQTTPQAESEIEQYEFNGSIENHPRGFWSVGIIAGAAKRNAVFDSPRTPVNFVPYKTSFDEASREMKLKLEFSNGIDLNSHYGARYESLDGKDLLRPDLSFGFRSRLVHTLSLGSIYRFPFRLIACDTSSVSLGVREEWGSGGEFFSPSTSLRLNWTRPLHFGADISWSRSRRLPDLVDLFWKEDVFATPNPDLKSEKSESLQFGADMEINALGDYNLRVARFRDSYRDLIIWRKWAGDKYKPVNLSSAETLGWEISLDLVPFHGPVSGHWSLSAIRPLNKEDEPSHHNKYLTFRPIGTQSAAIEFEFDRIYTALKGRHIGRRYTTEENTKSLSAVDIIDFEMEYRLNFKALHFALGFGVGNIGDIQYEILERQPEKPREYHFKLAISSKGKTT